MFQPGQFTISAFQKVKQVFQGVVKDEIVFSESKLIGLSLLEHCVDFDTSEGQTTLMAQTFKVQLNFDYHTSIAFEILEALMKTDTEFFESTQIGYIIDYIFEKHKFKFMW